ncbi:MAG: helix-turn-helix transcriptional regulator [Clostridia bacterium]|nr:helix-turn-helix transcriptional regulator [Clostridia bacterium]
MKLMIGENIRKFRKKNDMTQEAFADRLGVTYQSISRWENGSTYPDLELLPAISEALSITVDELLCMPTLEKEKRAEEAYDELRRECLRNDYDAERIVTLLRDIRRNHVYSIHAWRPWVEGNGRAFSNPKILPEVRLLAQAYLERHPMNPHVIETMSEIEDEEQLQEFLAKYTTPFDCSARALLFSRYFRHGNKEKFEPERKYQLYQAFNTLLCPRYLLEWNQDQAYKDAVNEFMETMLCLIRRDAVDDRPDMWVEDRVELGLKSAMRLVSGGKPIEAIERVTTVVRLLEETMKITDEVLLPTSCRFLDGMEWRAKEDWNNSDNNPDSPEERMIFISTQMNNMTSCYCIFPSRYYPLLMGKEFDPLRQNPEFQHLCERVRDLIVTRPKDK